MKYPCAYSSGNNSSNYSLMANAFLYGQTQMKPTYTLNLPYPYQTPKDLMPQAFPQVYIDTNGQKSVHCLR